MMKMAVFEGEKSSNDIIYILGHSSGTCFLSLFDSKKEKKRENMRGRQREKVIEGWMDKW